MEEQQEKQTVPLSLLLQERAKRQAAENQVQELKDRVDERESRLKKGWPWKLWQ